MTSIRKEENKTLKTLVHRCFDGKHGYKTAADDVKDPSMKTFFQQNSTERGAFAEELRELERNLGVEVTDTDSLTGKAHRGWINAKSKASSRQDGDVLEECLRGDEKALEDYNSALESAIHPNARDTIVRQRDRIQEVVEGLRTMEPVSR